MSEYKDFLLNKQAEVMEAIKPICEAHGIEKYDYVLDWENQSEVLVLDGQRIGCTANSVEAVIGELVGYVFLNTFFADRGTKAEKRVVGELVKRYWC